jgi:hypothetical protein
MNHRSLNKANRTARCARWLRASKVGQAYLWAVLVWVGFSPLYAAEDKVRLLERGVDTAYWMLLVVNAVWLLTAALLTPPIFAIVRSRPADKSAGFARFTSCVLQSGVELPYSAIKNNIADSIDVLTRRGEVAIPRGRRAFLSVL